MMGKKYFVNNFMETYIAFTKVFHFDTFKRAVITC